MVMIIILCVVLALVIMTTVGVITYLTSRKAKRRLKNHHKQGKHSNKPRNEKQTKAQLEKKEIVCGVLYPVPMHRQPAYHDATISLPHSEQACAEVLSLPLHPGLGDDDVACVIREVIGFFR